MPDEGSASLPFLIHTCKRANDGGPHAYLSDSWNKVENP